MFGGSQLIPTDQLFNHIGIEEGQYVAHLGCGGSGYLTFPLASRVGNTGKVYAVDILKSALARLGTEAGRRHLAFIQTVWANLEKYRATSIADNELDLALLANILYQSKNHPAIIQEAYRMVKPQGRLIVLDWKGNASVFGPPQEQRVDPTRIIELCEVNGFTFLEQFDAGPYHFALSFEK